MSDLQFNEQNYSMPGYDTGANDSKMAQWLIDKGIASTRKGAETILIIFSAVLLAITFFIMKDNLSNESTPVSESRSPIQESQI